VTRHLPNALAVLVLTWGSVASAQTHRPQPPRRPPRRKSGTMPC
jgi:hypothetical protein